MRKIALLCATSALIMPAMAHAQSTGTFEVEEEENIVVTGTRTQNGVEGIVVPDAARAQSVLTQEYIQRQLPGQSILNLINVVPGVNFTQDDPFGDAGGDIRMRGFDANRISLTFDGVPTNDTGNYAIYSGQQVDPELVERVSVNLGQTDVDSPTASAAGGTINYRTLIPSRQLGTRGLVSFGDFERRRGFAMIQTGELWENGLRAWFAASTSSNDQFRGPGEIHRQQFNFRTYYPLGSNGDFIALGGHYNELRNNFYRRPTLSNLRTVLGTDAVPTAANTSFTNPAIIGDNISEAQYESIDALNNDPSCVLTTPGRGRQNEGSVCGFFYRLSFNPANTGNIRGHSRFTLGEGLILTVDPTYSYTLANGGGSRALEESAPQLGGNSATSAAARRGIDLNGDGDVLDSIRVLTPNNTRTHRYFLTSSLIWEVADNHRLRAAYTFDRGEHRQTGEFGFLDPGGSPENFFGGRNGTPILDTAGNPVQFRNRYSVASLHQISGQYVGRFFDRRLRVEIGLRAPFFRRELNQYCYTNTGLNPTTGNPTGRFNPGGISTGGGFALCSPLTLAQVRALPNGVGLIAPFEQDYSFNAVLPNLGAVYNLGGGLSMFGSYARGFSAPRTDNLYRLTFVEIAPETTDAFDLGLRYTTGNVQAQASAWLINYQNRILSSFDPDLLISVDRNVGAVESYGFDASAAWQPFEPLTLYAFGSYISARYQSDVQIGRTNAPTGGATVPAGTPIFAPTAGRMVAETPEWQFGGRAQLSLGPVAIGLQGKWVDDRFATDVNDVIVRGYTVFDLDARLSLASLGLERTFFQLNVVNLFNERYIGSINSNINAGNICPVGATCGFNAGNPGFTPAAPRTIVGTVSFGF